MAFLSIVRRWARREHLSIREIARRTKLSRNTIKKYLRSCLISFERNRYSVPPSFANRPVSLRVYPDRLVAAAEGDILCEHVRVIQRSHKLPPHQCQYTWWLPRKLYYCISGKARPREGPAPRTKAARARLRHGSLAPHETARPAELQPRRRQERQPTAPTG